MVTKRKRKKEIESRRITFEANIEQDSYGSVWYCCAARRITFEIAVKRIVFEIIVGRIS